MADNNGLMRRGKQAASLPTDQRGNSGLTCAETDYRMFPGSQPCLRQAWHSHEGYIMKTQWTSAVARFSSNLVFVVATFFLTRGLNISAQPATAPAKLPAYEATGRLLNAIQFNGTLEDVRSLLEQGADANAKGNEGWHALQIAAKRGDLEMVRLLLEKGADVNATNDLGGTALDTAAYRSYPEIAKLLVEKGANINHVNSRGETPLFSAVEGTGTNLVEYFLAKGASLNQTNDMGDTPLISAVRDDKEDMVEFLLAKGANVNAETDLGQSPLDLALIEKHEALAQMLRNAGTTKSRWDHLQESLRSLGTSETAPAQPTAPAAPPPINRLVASGGYTDSQGYVTNAELLKPFTLTNSAGVVVNDAVLVKLTANKFLYKSSAGGGMLRLDALPAELQARFGYDAATASAQDSAEAAARAERARAEQLQREYLQQQAGSAAQYPAQPNNVALIIKAKAVKEWPTDYEMQAFVIKKQTEAYNWVASAVSAPGVPPTVFAQIKAKAAEEWPDDYDMQKFVINKQLQAYRGLQ